MRWKMGDVTLIDIDKMESSHIQNCLAMMRRKGFIGVEELGHYFGPGPQGDMASLAFEQAQSEAFNMRPAGVIDEFRTELASRGEEERDD